MRWKRWLLMIVVAVSGYAQAGDLRIPLPKRNRITPVQRLNRDGVKAIRKHEYEKAKTLFYKAYLFDPDDTFTLNNLGYVSELDGQLERAQRFYTLASQHATEAEVDLASSPVGEGKSLMQVVRNIPDLPMQINRANVEAVRLLSQGRALEAEQLLRESLARDPNNSFSLNNLGVAKEMEGELEEAVRYYSAAASSHSQEPAIVTLSSEWRGKAVSEMAEASARRVLERLHTQETAASKAARLNLRGVSAVNHNNWSSARQYFQQAYDLDPNSPFSLNNFGFLSEMDGDPETAQVFYENARRAQAANAHVGFATRRSAEGRKLFEVADDNDKKVEMKLAEEREIRRRQTGPIELKRRDGKPISQTEEPASQPLSLAPAEERPSLGPPQPPIPRLSPASPQPPPPPEPQTTPPQ